MSERGRGSEQLPVHRSERVTGHRICPHCSEVRTYHISSCTVFILKSPLNASAMDTLQKTVNSVQSGYLNKPRRPSGCSLRYVSLKEGRRAVEGAAFGGRVAFEGTVGIMAGGTLPPGPGRWRVCGLGASIQRLACASPAATALGTSLLCSWTPALPAPSLPMLSGLLPPDGSPQCHGSGGAA